VLIVKRRLALPQGNGRRIQNRFFKFIKNGDCAPRNELRPGAGVGVYDLHHFREPFVFVFFSHALAKIIFARRVYISTKVLGVKEEDQKKKKKHKLI
jgi:hypothetical protein